MKNIALFIFINFSFILILKIKYNLKKLILLLLVVIMSLSFFRILQSEEKFETLYKDINECTGIVKVVSYKEEKQYTNKYLVKVINLNEDNKLKNTKLIMYSKNDYKYGDIIYIEGEFEKPNEARNENGFNYKKYLKEYKIYGIVYTKNDKFLEESKSLLGGIKSFNKFLSDMIYQKYEKENAELLNAILLGNKKDLEDGLEETFSKSSLSHILAISGLHISYIEATLRKILDKAIYDKRIKDIIIIFFLIFFCIFSGGSPSCMRACFMIIFSIIGEMYFRKNNKINSICFSLFLILLINPYCINDIGMWLSYGGIVGINLFSKIIKRDSQSKVLKYIIDNINVSIGVQIIIFPIILYKFNTINFSFLCSNILVSILILPILILGYLSIIFPITGICKIENILLNLFVYIAQIVARIKIWRVYFITISNLSIACYFIIIFLIKRNYKNKKIIYIILIIIIIFSNLNFRLDSNLMINFLDVGQGDSCLIITPRKQNILIDGGEGGKKFNYDYGKNVVLPYLLNHKILKLDYIIISHFDSDHCRRINLYFRKYESRKYNNWKTSRRK